MNIDEHRKSIKKQVLFFLEQLDFKKDFIKEEGEYLSYNRFFYECILLKEYLSGKISDKIVVVCMDNCILLSQLYFTMMFMNQTIVVIDPQKGQTEIKGILDEIDNKFIIVHENTVSQLHEFELMLNYELTKSVDKSIDIKTIVLSLIGNCDFEKEYLRTFTSGTSGKPKGVKNSLFNLFAASIALGDKVMLKDYKTMAHCMPMTYMGGILNTLIMPFIFGNKIVLCSRFNIKFAMKFWKLVDEQSIDAIWLAPTMLDTIMQLDRGNTGVNYCKNNKPLFLIGFSNLTPKLRKKWEDKYQIPLLLSYGLTETLFVSTEIPNIPVKQTVGVLLDGVDWKEYNGEFLIRVPWMFLGYSNLETSDSFYESYYKTGDIVQVKDDFVKIVGRIKDLIIRGGMNISPIMIENIINTHSCIEECSVAGTTDMTINEIVICAYVVSREISKLPSKTILDSELKSLVLKELGQNYQVDSFFQLETLPKNLNGKPEKDTIRNLKEVNK